MDDICKSISQLDVDVSYSDVERALGPYFWRRNDDEDDDDDRHLPSVTVNNDRKDDHATVDIHMHNNGNDNDNVGASSPTVDCIHRYNNRGVFTPLLLASDKAQVNTVRFLLSLSSQYPQLTGHITADRAPSSHNTVLHHVAMSNTPSLLQVLWEHHDNDKNRDLRRCNGCCCCCNRYDWHTLTNAHGDTPFMMAATYNCDQLLQYWLSLLQKKKTSKIGKYKKNVDDLSDDDDDDDDDDASSLFGLKRRNASGDTAVSLAASHGHVAVLKVIIQHVPTVVVQTEDWERVQAAGRRTQQLLSQLQRQQKQRQKIDDKSQQQQEIQHMIDITVNKQRQINECLEVLQTALQKSSDTLAAELVASEERIVVSKKIMASTSQRQKHRNKKNKKANPRQRRQRQAKSDYKHKKDDDTSIDKEQELQFTTEQNDVEMLRLAKLDNGMRAVIVPGKTLGDEEQDGDNYEDGVFHDKSSDENMFQHQINILTANTPNDSNIKEIENEYDDVAMRMQALGFLDRRDKNPQQWLLLTAHGMALHLSPSQLDAVEWILKRQLHHTVPQARAIQDRLHDTGRRPPPP